MLRPPQQNDLNFIINSFLRSYKATHEGRRIPNPIFYRIYHPIIEDLIEASQICVYCDDADEGQIYSYMIYKYIDDVLCVHWAFTKHPYRRMGLMNQMVNEINVSKNPILCSFMGLTFDSLQKKYNLIYNPILRA